MFESITKKLFIEILKKSENELIFSRLNLTEAGCTKAMQLLFDNSNIEVNPAKARRCTAVNSNSLTFSNGSKLYFNPGEKYYRHGNIILQYGEEYDTFDEINKYNIVAYAIR